MYIERIRHTISQIYSRDELERAENKRKHILSKDAVSPEEEQARKDERNMQEQKGNSPEGQEQHPPKEMSASADARGPVLDIRV